MHVGPPAMGGGSSASEADQASPWQAIRPPESSITSLANPCASAPQTGPIPRAGEPAEQHKPRLFGIRTETAGPDQPEHAAVSSTEHRRGTPLTPATLGLLTDAGASAKEGTSSALSVASQEADDYGMS